MPKLKDGRDAIGIELELTFPRQIDTVINLLKDLRDKLVSVSIYENPDNGQWFWEIRNHEQTKSTIILYFIQPSGEEIPKSSSAE